MKINTDSSINEPEYIVENDLPLQVKIIARLFFPSLA